MLMKVERTERGLVIPVSPEMAHTLLLTEGTEVEVLSINSRHVTSQEALDTFERTLPQHEIAYRELAK